MANFNLCPAVHKTWFVEGGNTPASGGLLFTYVAGSSTKTTVYKDSAGAAQHTNPIVLDSGGNLPNGSEIWIPTGVTIDVVFAPSNDTDPPGSPYRTLNNLPGINDVSSSNAIEWLSGPSPTFISGTQFSLAGDQSNTFKNGRRIRTQNTGGTVYGRITSIVVAAGSTSVNTVGDGGSSLDSGLNATAYSILDPQNTSITEYHVHKDGGSVASAGNGTTNIWGIAGDSLHITGTNTIRSFSTASYAGAKRTVIADGAFLLQTSAAFLSCPSGNVTTAAGDRFELLASTAAHAVITQYQRADGTPITSAGFGNQSSGSVFAGPSSGAATTAAFRKLVGAESAYVLLATKTAVSSTALTFTSTDGVDFTAYDEYQFRFYNLQPSNNAVTLNARVSFTHGVSWVSSGSYNHAVIGGNQVTTSADSGGGTLTSIQIFSNAANFGQTNNTTRSANGSLILFAPNTGIFKQIMSDSVYTDQNNNMTRVANASDLIATNPVNGMQFLYSAGSTNAGSIRCYGLRTS